MFEKISKKKKKNQFYLERNHKYQNISKWQGCSQIFFLLLFFIADFENSAVVLKVRTKFKNIYDHDMNQTFLIRVSSISKE